MVNRERSRYMAPKRRGIDLMKKVADKQAADRRRIAEDNEKQFRQSGRRPTL